MYFTVTVPDNYLTALGKKFGNESKPQEAIQAVLDTYIKSSLVQVIDTDPEVLALKDAYELKRKEKEAAIASAQAIMSGGM